jgi:RNA polymerase sigma-70 factor (ECF subfamily)
MGHEVDYQSEQALVRRSARGDERAFGLLVERYQGMVFSLCHRLLRDPARAEDAAQDTFLKAWSALPGFRGDARFSSWVYRIAYNTCISQLRKQRPEVELDEERPAPTPGPAEELRAGDIRRAIDEEVARLPEEYSAVLTLYHLNGMRYDEICSITRRPMGTVKAQLHRARALLRTRLVERVGWESLREVMWR